MLHMRHEPVHAAVDQNGIWSILPRLKLWRLKDEPSQHLQSHRRGNRAACGFAVSLDDRAATVCQPTHALPSDRHGRREMRRFDVRTLHRARALSENRTCRFCRHAQVEPIELDDPQYGRGNLPIPGTASLVGFRCHSCRSEWPHGPTGPPQ